MELQNTNPTILNAADLPSRRTRERRRSRVAEEDADDDNNYSDTNHSSLFDDDYDDDDDNLTEEPIDEQEIYDLISTISDPEHPLSLGSLAVVNLPDIHISNTIKKSSAAAAAAAASSPPPPPLRTVTVLITPTITHCSLATVIGLGVRVRLEQSLPPRFRVDVRIKEGSHTTANEVTKQLRDKERVAAALENTTLMGVIGRMLETCQ